MRVRTCQWWWWKGANGYWRDLVVARLVVRWLKMREREGESASPA